MRLTGTILAAALAAGGAAAETITRDFPPVVTEEVTMGRSDRAPPNARAAASPGVRRVVTTTQLSVTGEAAEVNALPDSGDLSGCASCLPASSLTVVVTGPGRSR